MSAILFEKDGRGPGGFSLVLRGVVLFVLMAVVVTALLMKSTGRFDAKVEVIAVLDQLGDGLPARSDVKFRGLLIGTVATVALADDGGPNRVTLLLEPAYASSVPRTVTARVVPSNVFAVSSIQLVDNGPGPALTADTEIAQDRSLSTVQLQTALTKLREIIASTGRLGSDSTVGLLAAVAEATDRRGDDIVRAGAQLDRITREFDALLAPDGGPSTLGAMAEAVHGLNAAAPDLLDALHSAVVPLRTVVEREGELLNLLSAGNNTLSSLGGGLTRHADQIVTVTNDLVPVLDVVGEGAAGFAPIVVRIKRISDLWFAEFWNSETQMGTGKFQFRLSPHTAYTRADCPRYGELSAPSCATAPVAIPEQELPPSMSPQSYPVPPLSPQMWDMIRRILGGEANAAESVLAQLLADAALPIGGGR
ncbi:mammalian cell entry protein [Nocardia mangyaensis]|uniref:Mammalian cell entry protein n=1 Tax=Nocardia mangyaensis TaxID=2213200 RepID=A0A1J0VUF0_9NOCA|nr:MCE family protein [Nocardia mangyaensis]APE35626.1 mammalian cell entry protein [Nocardia mangyaensis]